MESISKEKLEGFTLVELMIVVFIISILSSFFVYSLRTPNTTKNVRVESGLNQISKLAGVLRNNESSYQNLSCSGTDAGIRSLCNDVVKNSLDGVFKIATSSDGKAYCAVAKVYSKTGADEWQCVSSNAGYAIVTSTTIVNDCKAANCINCLCQ